MRAGLPGIDESSLSAMAVATLREPVYSRQVRKPIALFGCVATALAACTNVQTPDTPNADPDRVVGIELKCDLLMWAGSPNQVRMYTYTGWDVCAGPGWDSGLIGTGVPEGWANRRKELTVRMANGYTYDVSYGYEHEVWLGMEWPPR